ncbi:uncharacterized protein LOC111442092 [Cucurbita moschata]|uniref:Uncharacterized protein LOC111442092 n=1 Tax=Cucurbita moschata TaxID=3662 RepID=A0A6J1F4I5_CUCMO|nr:uncharacterized protein LOC111442092 [Cucurbita moschata]
MAMRRDCFLALFLCHAVVSEVTNASLWDSRKLLEPASNNNSTRTSQGSPVISPISSVNISDSAPVIGKKKQVEPPPPSPNNSSSSLESNVLNNSSSRSSSTVSETGSGKPIDTKKENGTEASALSSKHETCDGVPDNKKCRDQNKLIACIQSNLIESRGLAVLVLNEGEDTLEVNVTGGNFFKGLKILKHHKERITIPLTTETSYKLILDAGNGECVLYRSPLVSGENLFLHLPSFDQLATPVNGAYFLILAVLIFGGSWACCKFRRRQAGGIPYQELEMALPESSSAVNVETADGWDQGWDDDWDEENAVKSPGGRHIGSISANGLTARSNKDGWENDWDV